MDAHFHVSGTHALVVMLEVIALFGSLHLFAISFPGSKLAQAWLALGF
jgi:hypothetical protein